jgi:hypothetical protein
MPAYGRSTTLAVACCLAGFCACKSEPAKADAAIPDARSDAMSSCNDYPMPGIRLCPSNQPYCCPLGEYQWCSADSRMGACREHPIGGLRQLCDTATGGGCPADHPICCGVDTNTFCTDHVYVGDWQCSN